MQLTEKQKGVVRGAGMAMVITLITLIGVLFWQPDFLTPSNTMAGRLSFALKADLFVVLLLVISIGRLARHRFHEPADIDGGGMSVGTARAKSLQAILQNTLEQTVLAITLHILWAVIAPVSWLAAIPVAVGLFVIGRLLFFSGYESGAPARAVGFGLTFYPNVLLLIILALIALRIVG
ncbi:MAPEG family protein [Limibacillus halophilus]|uniref:MAPEG family protein n=1 Tax=Limibacillus halophilus TaxID=1579333 RepID=A0A839SQA8_9PROT|nr:MAPEG family protein [Limibacillus halophilus]MBB3064991.1 hypothetical protein [Limibacillus halophilus]